MLAACVGNAAANGAAKTASKAIFVNNFFIML
jgi:hypothetical protein